MKSPFLILFFCTILVTSPILVLTKPNALQFEVGQLLEALVPNRGRELAAIGFICETDHPRSRIRVCFEDAPELGTFWASPSDLNIARYGTSRRLKIPLIGPTIANDAYLAPKSAFFGAQSTYLSSNPIQNRGQADKWLSRADKEALLWSPTSHREAFPSLDIHDLQKAFPTTMPQLWMGTSEFDAGVLQTVEFYCRASTMNGMRWSGSHSISLSDNDDSHGAASSQVCRMDWGDFIDRLKAILSDDDVDGIDFVHHLVHDHFPKMSHDEAKSRLFAYELDLQTFPASSEVALLMMELLSVPKGEHHTEFRPNKETEQSILVDTDSASSSSHWHQHHADRWYVSLQQQHHLSSLDMFNTRKALSKLESIAKDVYTVSDNRMKYIVDAMKDGVIGGFEVLAHFSRLKSIAEKASALFPPSASNLRFLSLGSSNDDGTDSLERSLVSAIARRLISVQNVQMLSETEIKFSLIANRHNTDAVLFHVPWGTVIEPDTDEYTHGPLVVSWPASSALLPGESMELILSVLQLTTPAPNAVSLASHPLYQLTPLVWGFHRSSLGALRSQPTLSSYLNYLGLHIKSVEDALMQQVLSVEEFRSVLQSLHLSKDSLFSMAETIITQCPMNGNPKVLRACHDGLDSIISSEHSLLQEEDHHDLLQSAVSSGRKLFVDFLVNKGARISQKAIESAKPWPRLKDQLEKEARKRMRSEEL